MAKKVNPYDHLNGFNRPGLSFPEQLLETTVGRQDLIDKILEELENQLADEGIKNKIFMGPPGIGKTHFMRILGTTIQKSRKLSKLYTVIQFPEENHRILTFADLLLGIAEILGNISGDKRWEDLHLKLEEVDDDSEIIAEILSGLELYCKNTESNLLVILENLDQFFKGQLKDSRNVKEFKDFLTKASYVRFLGTSAHNLIKTDELKKSPYNLFEMHILDVLTENQTTELIQKNLTWDKREELLEIFSDLIPRIKALHKMSGGNPRLSLILYELIAKENKWDVKRQIEKLLDQTSPLFRDRLKTMAPQEKAVLEAIASMRLDLKTSSSIAKNLRLSIQQTTSLLNKLQKAGLLIITDNPTDKRTNTYRIREGFFDLWLSIGHSRQQNIVLPRLVEFLEKWYAEKLGRERKRQQIWNSLRSLDSPNYFHQVKSQEQLLNYLSDIGDSEEKAQNKFEMVYYYLVNDKIKEAKALIREIKRLPYKRPYYFDQMLSYCMNWISKDIDPATLQQIEDTILCWKLQKDDNSEELSKRALKLANNYLNNGIYELNISFLQDILKFVNDPLWMILLLEKVALSYEKLNNPQNALIIWEEILQIAEKSGDMKSKGMILNNISQIHQDLEDFDVALEYLNRSLEILQKINDHDGQGTTLNNISTIFFSQGYYEKALELLEEALVITRRSRNLTIEGITLSNISLIYQARGDFEKALEYLSNSLLNMRKTNNRYAECTTLNNISQIYLEIGNLEESLDHVNLALSMMEELKDNAGVCLSLFNRGNIYWQNENKNQAVLDWLSAYKIASEHQINDILSRLEKLSISLGENGLDFWKKTLEKLHEKEKVEANSSG